MRIAVIGATGIAGRAAVREAVRRGHEVRAVARTAPSGGVLPGVEFAAADALSGTGLAAALEGIDVVIDCSNIATQNRQKATDFFVGATKHLVAAGAAAGVSRHVVLSIVGIDDVPTGYYAAKLAQEATARAGTVPVTVVRATQFHDFPSQLLSMTRRGPVALVPAMPVQTVSTADVSAALLDAAESTERVDLIQVGGPERRDLVDLARRTLRAQGRRAFVVPLPIPGAAGRAIRGGGLLLGEGRRGAETFEEWAAGGRERA